MEIEIYKKIMKLIMYLQKKRHLILYYKQNIFLELNKCINLIKFIYMRKNQQVYQKIVIDVES